MVRGENLRRMSLRWRVWILEKEHQRCTLLLKNNNNSNNVKGVRILLCFSRGDDGPRKSNWVREDDALKQKKQIKMKQFPF